MEWCSCLQEPCFKPMSQQVLFWKVRKGLRTLTGRKAASAKTMFAITFVNSLMQYTCLLIVIVEEPHFP